MARYALLADPDSGFSRMARAEIERGGLDVVAVSDGAEAHRVLAMREVPALVVSELALPKRDGFALLRGLRRVDTQRAVPAIVASAFPALRDSAASLRNELGPLVVLAKPVSPAALRAALTTTLSGAAKAAAAPPPTAPRPPAFEARRLARIQETGLVDEAPPPDELQRIVDGVAKAFGVPVALISFVLEERQWFKAHVGLTGELRANRGSPRDWAFCKHVVEGHQPLVVPDARQHPVFADNPLVRDGTVVGYAGVPLETTDGYVLGSLCIIDQRPLDIGVADLERLTLLARRVAGEIALSEANRRLERSSQRMNAASDPAPLAYLEAAMGLLDTGVIVLDASRRVAFANPAACAMLGQRSDALVGKTRAELIAVLATCLARPADVERLRVAEDGPWALREVLELRTPARRIVRWAGAPMPVPGGAGQLVSLTDVTAEADLATERDELARTDVLTGLLNRRGAIDVLAREVARAARRGTPLSVAIVDVDHFKAVNDLHGHATGDVVLAHVASTLRASVRACDEVARWGGEEFLLVLPDARLEDATSVVERARSAIATGSEGKGVRATASGGVAAWRAGERIEATLARADAALYQAKAAGRNRTVRSAGDG